MILKSVVAAVVVEEILDFTKETEQIAGINYKAQDP